MKKAFLILLVLLFSLALAGNASAHDRRFVEGVLVGTAIVGTVYALSHLDHGGVVYHHRLPPPPPRYYAHNPPWHYQWQRPVVIHNYHFQKNRHHHHRDWQHGYPGRHDGPGYYRGHRPNRHH